MVDSDKDHWRPRTRKDCELVQRPCPYVGCRYNLGLDVKGKGMRHQADSRKTSLGISKIGNDHAFNRWSDVLLKTLEEMPFSCALDAAEQGGMTLEQVGESINISRQMVQQIELRGVRKIRHSQELPILQEAHSHGREAAQTQLGKAQAQAHPMDGIGSNRFREEVAAAAARIRGEKHG